MPGGDGTGPLGLGPGTGRRMGYCFGYNVPGFMNPGFGFGRGFWGRGFGRGFGRGMGFGRGFAWRARMFSATPTIQPQVITETDEKQLLNEEKEYIKEEIGALKKEMQEIEKRLKELKD